MKKNKKHHRKNHYRLWVGIIATTMAVSSMEAMCSTAAYAADGETVMVLESIPVTAPENTVEVPANIIPENTVEVIPENTAEVIPENTAEVIPENPAEAVIEGGENSETAGGSDVQEQIPEIQQPEEQKSEIQQPEGQEAEIQQPAEQEVEAQQPAVMQTAAPAAEEVKETEEAATPEETATPEEAVEEAPTMLMRFAAPGGNTEAAPAQAEGTSIEIYVTDRSGNPCGTGDKMFVFLTGPNNDRITGVLDENGRLTVTQVYDQNGNNLHEIPAGTYRMILAGEKQVKDVTGTTRYDQNNFDTYQNGQKLDGSSTLSFSDTITVSKDMTNQVNIQLQEKEGVAYSAEDIYKQIGDAANYGIYTRELSLGADSEATIAVETVKYLGSNYGMSDNNYNATNNTLHVTGSVTENDAPVPGVPVTVKLYKNGTLVQTVSCTTDEAGRIEYSFEHLRDGNYTVSMEDEDEIVSSEENIAIKPNTSYVGSAANAQSLNKMRGAGYLIVGDDELYNALVNDQEILAHGITVEKGSVDINESMNRMESLSSTLSQASTSSSVKVYDMSAAEFNRKNYHFRSSGKDYILVNVDMTGYSDFYFQGEHYIDGVQMMADFKNDTSNRIIFNFITKDGDTVKPYEGTLRTGSMTTGMILAPSATVYGACGNHGGTIVAGSYTHNTGEVHEKKASIDKLIDLMIRKKLPEPEIVEPEPEPQPEPEPEIVEPEPEPQPEPEPEIVEPEPEPQPEPEPEIVEPEPEPQPEPELEIPEEPPVRRILREEPEEPTPDPVPETPVPENPKEENPTVENPTPAPETPAVSEPTNEPTPEPEESTGTVLGAGRSGEVLGEERTQKVLGAERAHTGDESGLNYWIALMGASAAALAAFCLKHLKKEEEEEDI